ncbi:MAG TPA: PAS domain-containing protein, partial [Aquabacterium sp.]|nr:PAS domain-containing protein [Aquabacterium sp.]
MNASRIVGLFLAFGVAWILISDRILEFLIQDPHARQTAQSVKGVAFVLASTLLIYVLVRQAERERSRLEAETLREKDRLARVLEVAPAVIYSLRADPTGQGFVTDFVSDQIEPMMGYRVDQWMAQPDFWRQHVHPDDLSQVERAQQTLFESGSVHHEYRFLHADGVYRWVNDHLILQRDADGRPAQIHGAWLDISERKRVELAMIEADRR